MRAWIKFGVLSAVLALSAAALSAEEAQAIVIEWRAVRGSYGYVVEYRNERTGRVASQRVRESRVRLNLRPGHYSIRVAGLNKFRRPGPFSDWHPLLVTAAPEPAPVRLTRIVYGEKKERPPKKAAPRKQAKGALKKSPPQKRPLQARKGRAPQRTPSAERTLLRWPNFIPGLPQLQEGETFRGTALLVLFGGLFVYGLQESQAADSLARDPQSSNTVPLVLLLRNVPLQQGILLLPEYFNQQADYDQRRDNATGAAAAALLVYILHWLDVIDLNTDRTFRFSLDFRPDHAAGFALVPRGGRRADVRFTFVF